MKSVVANSHHLAGEFQQGIASKNIASFFELLAVIAIGIFGMFLSQIGLETNNLFDLVIGIFIEVAAAGWIITRFINELLDLINRFRKKDYHDRSHS